MAIIDQLVDEVTNKDLRTHIKKELKDLRDNKKFGLVFEEHLPEHVLLYNSKIKKGTNVVQKENQNNEVYKVNKVEKDMAYCSTSSEQEEKLFPVEELTAIKHFGEPIYPTIIPIDYVEKVKGKPYNAIIEADNFHALHMLEYLYSGKIDCIYIDPPYNTGARDWKYNNNYVDENDSYKHSKWLSFMKKRLLIAKRLLTLEGTLIIAIDHHEMAHLVCLLEELFPEYDLTIVTVVHNPRGNVTKNFSQVHEYAIYLTPKGISTISRISVENVSPRKLRRWGHNSTREARRSMFYPIYVNDGKVTRFGETPLDDYHPVSRNIVVGNGEIEIWPIDQNGVERRWNYSRDSIGNHLERIIPLPKDDGIDLFLSAELSPPKTFMARPELDAGGAYGSTLVETITQKKFPYPKSLYSILKCIEPVVLSKPDAIVLDFFAGSGTTFHALSLINQVHGGNRQCILVTNNEVHPENTAKQLIANGINRGTAEFEKHGICQTITYPRCRNVINGYREDGTEIPGELITGRKKVQEVNRVIRSLGFTTQEQLSKINLRKQLVAMLGLTQSKVKMDSDWYIESDETTSILFNPDKADEYCSILFEQGENLENIYIVMPEGKAFKAVKEKVIESLPPLYRDVDEKIPLAKGLEENLQYFKLGFLDPVNVELGREFSSLLPFLWMMSGMKGTLPTTNLSDKYCIPDGCSFAVLIEEVYFKEFLEELQKKKDINYVFLITDSEEAFFTMKQEFSHKKVIHLYKHYLDNFCINI
jgi:adenine-specific DNA-methyltransferase